MTAMPERWRVLPGRPVTLASIDPSSTPGAPGGKAETLATLPAFHQRLAGLQDRLWAAHGQSLRITAATGVVTQSSRVSRAMSSSTRIPQ